ncbi:MAG: phage BR0599 family protein, partial [bacterium]
ISGNKIYDENITEASDYWSYGIITVGSENRKITYSAKGFVELEYSFLLAEEGQEYKLKAGCDYGFDTKHGCKYWDNSKFYGGFLDIPKIRNVRRVD